VRQFWPVNPDDWMRTAAILGCGKRSTGKEGWAIGHAHATGYREADPSVRLLGVDPNPENLEAFGGKFGLPKEDLFASTDELYAKLIPDTVSVCTWPPLHAPMVIEASNRGVKGILCEKPMALNGLEIRQMISTCRKNGTQLAIGHQRRHNPAFNLLKRLLDEGAVGDHWMLEARVGDGWDMLSWTVHWFDMANFLYDATPLWLLAGMDHTGQRRYQHAVEDRSVVFVQYPGNKQAVFITGPSGDPESSFFVRGQRGLLACRGNAVCHFGAEGMTQHEAPAGPIGEFGAACRELFAAMESQAPMACGADRCAMATEMAYAAQESARTMRRIEFPLPVEFAPLEVAQARPSPRLPSGVFVLFADDHFGSGGREGIAEALTEHAGRRPILLAADKGLCQSDLEGAGLLLLYHTQANADLTTRRTLETWVEGGKPLVLIHAALGAYPDWDRYKEWAGRHWVWDGPAKSAHPHQASELRVLSDANLALAWETAWLPQDEVFIQLQQAAPCRDLLTAQIPEGTFPAAWISRQRPNIGVWVPGHRRDLWRVPAMREGLIALIQATAGAKAPG